MTRKHSREGYKYKDNKRKNNKKNKLNKTKCGLYYIYVIGANRELVWYFCKDYLNLRGATETTFWCEGLASSVF